MSMPNMYSQQGQGGYGYSQPPQQGNYDQQPLMGPGGGYPPGSGGSYPPQQGNYPPQGGFQQGGGYPPQMGYPSGAPANSLKQMQTTTSMNLVFFGAACCIILGAFISGLSLLCSWEWVDCLECCYLVIFGGILAVLDTPFMKTIKIMGDLKMYIGKYIQLLTRVTGKGITFLFLGSSLFTVMVDNLEGGFMIFLAVVLCFFPVVVGFAAIVIGIMKSQKLAKARHLLSQGAIEHRYLQWAQTYQGPQGGLTPTEFNSLTMENGGFKWEDADLKLIFNALVSNPAWRINAQNSGRPMDSEPKIPKEDLMSWVRGGMVWL